MKKGMVIILSKKLIIHIIVAALLIGYLIFSYMTRTNQDGKRLELETSNIIKIWDGRTGESFVIDRMDYISRIRAVVDDMSYIEILNLTEDEQKIGSSFNVTFEDENGAVLTTISFEWPESTVVINDKTYKLVEDKKYLLYAYIADALYLFKYDESIN